MNTQKLYRTLLVFYRRSDVTLRQKYHPTQPCLGIALDVHQGQVLVMDAHDSAEVQACDEDFVYPRRGKTQVAPLSILRMIPHATGGLRR